MKNMKAQEQTETEFNHSRHQVKKLWGQVRDAALQLVREIWWQGWWMKILPNTWRRLLNHYWCGYARAINIFLALSWGIFITTFWINGKGENAYIWPLPQWERKETDRDWLFLPTLERKRWQFLLTLVAKQVHLWLTPVGEHSQNQLNPLGTSTQIIKTCAWPGSAYSVMQGLSSRLKNCCVDIPLQLKLNCLHSNF